MNQTNNEKEKEVDALCPECGNAFKLFVDRVIANEKDPDAKAKGPCPVCGCSDCKIGK